MTIQHTRPCTTCGELIFFIKNSEGRFVPMNAKDGRPHFETCKHKPLANYKPNPLHKQEPLEAFTNG